MSQINSTNGASLEDCHTNFFALADLSGIKWRRLRKNDHLSHSANASSKDPLDDPVLSSYSKCLSAGELLCAWTRVANQSSSSDAAGPTTPTTGPTFSKELWIFWYSNDPDLSEYLSSDLTEVEQGSWENGLSYECRTVLFKAFHNLIERNLLSRGFARFGKWFTFPTTPTLQSSSSKSTNKRGSSGSGVGSSSSTAPSNSDTSSSSTSFPLPPGVQTHLSFSFEFFVHGDSTVCATVDVRQRPPIYRLNRQLLSIAQSTGVPVILSPYGLSGTLTGQSFKENDSLVQKCLSDWKKFYSLNLSQNTNTTGSNTSSSSASSSSSSSFASSSRQQQQSSSSSSFKFEDSSSSSSDSPELKSLPPVVEVIVAGVPMKYPSSYVFHVRDSSSLSNRLRSPSSSCQSINTSTTLAKDCSNNNSSSSSIPGRSLTMDALLTPPNSPNSQTALSTSMFIDSPPRLKTPVMSCQQPVKPAACFIVRNATEQDVTLVKHPPPTPSVHALVDGGDGSSYHESEGHLDFVDPSNKVACNCSRCKSSNKNNRNGTPSKDSKFGGNSANSNSSSTKKEKGNSAANSATNRSSCANRNNHHQQQPFHKRNQSLPVSFSLFEQSKQCTNNTTTQSSSPIGSLQQQSSSLSNQPTQNQPKTPLLMHKSPAPGGLPSIQSNATTPGPVDSPHSVAPSSVAGGDGPGSVGGLSSLPSVSPHPAKDTSSDFHDSSTSFTPLSQGPQSIQGLREKSQLEQLLSPGPSSNKSNLPFGNDSTSGLLWSTLAASTPTQDQSNHESKIEPEGDEPRRATLSKTLLHDFSCLSPEMESWDLPQPKRRRMIPKQSQDSMIGNQSSSKDNNELVSRLSSRDPYEFSDGDFNDFGVGPDRCRTTDSDNQQTNLTMMNGKFDPSSSTTQQHISSHFQGIESTILASPQTPGHQQFTRSDELKPSYDDLNQIFEETSGDESSDGNASNRIKSSNNNNRSTTMTSSTQDFATLKRMYPTPPSLDSQNAASPSTATLLAELERENVDAPCSPAFDRIRESSDVYKPKQISKIIAASKYAPLLELPTPINLPPECRYRPRSTNITMGTNSSDCNNLSTNQRRKSTVTVKSPVGYLHQQPSPLPPPSVLNRTLQGAPTYARPPSLNVNIRSPGSFTPSVAVSSPLQGALTGNMHLFSRDGMLSPYSSGHRPPLPGPISDSRSAHTFETSTPAEHPFRSATTEISSVIINLALSDSILNLHKDHNFDSCTLCVCNMNIKGSDAGLYLPETVIQGVDEPQYKCTCGFSAVVNRMKSQFAGLFYEDEVEVTGILYEPVESFRKSRGLPLDSSSSIGLLGVLTEGNISATTALLLEILRTQCQYTIPCTSFFAKTLFTELVFGLNRGRFEQHLRHPLNHEMSLFRSDSCEIALMALHSGKSIFEFFPKVINNVHNIEARKAVKKTILHEWLFMDPDVPSNNHDVVRFLRNLQPILQESVQKKPKRSAMWETASGNFAPALSGAKFPSYRGISHRAKFHHRGNLAPRVC